MSSNSSTDKDATICDQCENYEYKGVIVWGRAENEAEKKLNDDLEAEGKAYWCAYFERYFNKSFKKRKRHCEVMDEGDI
jgi:hypothetical protein